ncbi:Sad1-UNC-like carboxy terminal [Schizosaccharomyces octosporus yFS286]|uniref:SUN-like protein 1 n=1 Tax=Schizosaccharomyces octosporus (strain yFS286) TaxID=483514 RepID=S9Q1T7_SCHOY|nr:Sad1-UNC-like carboxy terminal [Schizosaccharomyces octosporus yFS286]EPX74072.1 Sad1-UNC-like carboxy terminal [Schizosaccharomyces octosporus yFS286]
MYLFLIIVYSSYLLFLYCNALISYEPAVCENTLSVFSGIFHEEPDQSPSSEYVQEDISSDEISETLKYFETTDVPAQYNVAETSTPSIERELYDKTASTQNITNISGTSSARSDIRSTSLERSIPQASINTAIPNEVNSRSTDENTAIPRSQTSFGTSTSFKEGFSPETESAAHVTTSEEKRFNFASTDCAAAVLKTNVEAEGASSILTENKDKYMLNKCSATKKFVIIELCEDIYVDTVQIANFEFFSSIFRTVRISVSGKYPKQESSWMELGTFTAMNLRTLQSFHIENPLIWAKYMKIEILSHYGSEFYCPLSLVHVFGKTMIEEFEEENEEGYSNDYDLSQNDQADVINSNTRNNSQFIPPEQTTAMLNTVENKSESPSSILNSASSSPTATKSSEIKEKQSIVNNNKERVSNPLFSSVVASNMSSSSAAGSPPFPTTTHHLNQESIYKNINKRLSTLEERKKLFDEAIQKLLASFGKHETKQLNLSDLLNEIIVSHKEEFDQMRYQYQRLQSSFYILQARLELASAENEFVQRRIQSLSDDSSFQKRLLVLQLTLLIVLVVYIAVSYFPVGNDNVLLQPSSASKAFDYNDGYQEVTNSNDSENGPRLSPLSNSMPSKKSSLVYKVTEKSDDDQSPRPGNLPVSQMKNPGMKRLLHSRSYSVY